MIHATEKSLKDLGDVQADEKSSIEAAIEELKAVLKDGDKETIEAKTNALTEVSSKLAERVYAKMANRLALLALERLMLLKSLKQG